MLSSENQEAVDQKNVHTSENIKNVGEIICSQENQPGTSKSTRKIAEEY